MQRWLVWSCFAVASSVVSLGCEDDGVDSPDGGMCEVPEPVVCAMAVASQVPLELTSSNEMAQDDHGGASCARGGGTGNRDVAFQFTAPAAGLYDITTEGSSFDTVLSVRRGCGGEEVACNDDIARGNVRSALVVELAACETVIIVVDGFAETDLGAVSVRVSTRESVCDDGLDEDGDGATDCDDPDCFSIECSGDDWPADWQAFEWEVLELTNAARARGATCDMDVFAPAPALEMDEVIREAARGHSLDMGEQDYFEHDSLDGRTFADRMRDVGFSGASPWGENIAAGQRTAASVVEGWMNSPGHCRNIMDPSYRVIGIGYAEVTGATFDTFWTQDFAASH